MVWVLADTTPAKIIAVFNNLELPEPKNHFTVGIVDDVTFTSLPLEVEGNSYGWRKGIVRS
jgi:pyruvate-ferredoxin/flavodoxin oxidoreductase